MSWELIGNKGMEDICHGNLSKQQELREKAFYTVRSPTSQIIRGYVKCRLRETSIVGDQCKNTFFGFVYNFIIIILKNHLY